MTGQSVSVDLRVPIRPDTITRLLEDEGFEVGEVNELRSGGPVFAADALSFIVEHLDDALIPILVAVVTKLMSMRRSQPDQGDDQGVTFSIREEGVGDIYVINVTGDGSWVQLHPKPDTPNEEE